MHAIATYSAGSPVLSLLDQFGDANDRFERDPTGLADLRVTISFDK